MVLVLGLILASAKALGMAWLWAWILAIPFGFSIENRHVDEGAAFGGALRALPRPEVR